VRKHGISYELCKQPKSDLGTGYPVERAVVSIFGAGLLAPAERQCSRSEAFGNVVGLEQLGEFVNDRMAPSRTRSRSGHQPLAPQVAAVELDQFGSLS
jgi:hypothetical protein